MYWKIDGFYFVVERKIKRKYKTNGERRNKSSKSLFTFVHIIYDLLNSLTYNYVQKNIVCLWKDVSKESFTFFFVVVNGLYIQIFSPLFFSLIFLLLFC